MNYGFELRKVINAMRNEKGIRFLHRLWNVCRTPLRELIGSYGMSQTDFARIYSIPLRTVQHWCGGDRECPLYVRLQLFDVLPGAGLLGSHDGNWHMFDLNGFRFYGCDISDDFVILVNGDGRFIVAKKYTNCLSIGSGVVKEFGTFQDAVDGAYVVMDDPFRGY